MGNIFANIPETNQKRIVIIGAGFAGLNLAKHLGKYDLQVVLVDKNNYHQFQPLFYQVAMAGLEPSSILFPIRKIFQTKENIHIRITEVLSLEKPQKRISTKLGIINYDFLVLAMGATTNFYGQENILKNSLGMKTISEAIHIRNRILQNFEDALSHKNKETRSKLMTVVVVGGGPTGVELSGTLAEMKNKILPKDYPELNFDEMKIYLFQSSGELLKGMSAESSEKSLEYLRDLGVEVRLNERVSDYDGQTVSTNKGEKIETKNLVWAAGIRGNLFEGIPDSPQERSGRIRVNQYNLIEGEEDIFAIGDIAQMNSEEYPYGHPQMAQPAIQQGKLLAKNLFNIIKNEEPIPFKYNDKGSMATIGRNLAVVDLPFFSFQGILAWYVWMLVHLLSILGIKNKALVLTNWIWNYFTYDQSLRLIIKPVKPKK